MMISGDVRDGDMYELENPVDVTGVGGTITCTKAVDHRDLGKKFLINPKAPGNIVGGAMLADLGWIYYDQDYHRFNCIIDPNKVYVFNRIDNMYLGNMWRSYTMKQLNLLHLPK